MPNGGRTGAGFWARTDVRRRWRSLVTLGLLAGVTAGFAMAAFAGVRRTSSALPRLRSVTHAPDALVFASQSGVLHPDFDALRHRPGVKSLAVWDLVFGNINGETGDVLFASDDGSWGRDINRPVVKAGRMWRPDATDEVVVDENLAKQGVKIGIVFEFATLGPTLEDLNANNVTGPVVHLKVVGIVREVRQFLFATSGQGFLPPGFIARYRGQAAIHPNADVVLQPGRPMADLRTDVNDVIGAGTPVLDVRAVERRVRTTLGVERSALLLLGLAIAIAGGLLVTQALARSAATVGDDARVLRAMGMSRVDVAAAPALSHAVSALVAGAVALVTSIVASQWFPVGLGRRIDPDVGIHADWVVVGGGVALTIVLVILGAFSVGASAGALREGHSAAGSASTLGAIRRRTPLPVGLGLTLAFDRGRGRTRVPVLPAVAGAVVGVLGVSCALTINRGLRDALSHPERAGVTWDISVLPSQDAFSAGGVRPDLVQTLSSVSKGSLAIINRQLIPLNGVGVPTFSVEAVDGGPRSPVSYRLVSGRAPRTDGEVAIGPATAHEIHVKLGDSVRIGDEPAPVKIVGEALFPADVHSEFDEGAWLTGDHLDRLTSPDLSNGFRAVAIRLPKGAHRQGVVGGLQKALPPDTTVAPEDAPDELANLRNVRTLPIVLAAFLALLAVAALSHVLISSARRRRRDFAILRALGLDRRASRLTLNAQGTAIGAVGLLVGIPLGVALGRALWRLVTERVPLANVAPFAVVAVVVIVPATVVLANGLALWPGHRVARLRAADELRAE